MKNQPLTIVLRKNISAIAENLGILYARSIGSADGKKSTNFFGCEIHLHFAARNLGIFL